MIKIKTAQEIEKIIGAGKRLSSLFGELEQLVRANQSTLDIDTWITKALQERDMVTQTKGYMGYRHASCVSVNDEIVHGVPSATKILHPGDLVKVDVCAAWSGYCADMARCFIVPGSDSNKVASNLVTAAQKSLDEGIDKARPMNYLSDISAAIQRIVEDAGFGIVRDFCGHGIGKTMHEEPEIVNYGCPGRGPVLKPGMVFAIEPMITEKDYRVKMAADGWTASTYDGGLAAHVEDTVVITQDGPLIVTRTRERLKA